MIERMLQQKEVKQSTKVLAWKRHLEDAKESEAEFSARFTRLQSESELGHYNQEELFVTLNNLTFIRDRIKSIEANIKREERK